MQRKIGIVYVVSTLRRCGPVKQLLFLIGNLDRTLFSPHIITLRLEPEDSLKDSFECLVDSIIELQLNRPQLLCIGIKKASQQITRLAPQIIHSQGFTADLLTSLLRTNAVKVTTQRNYPFEDYVMEYGRVLGMIMSYLHYWAFRKIQQPVTCSLQIADRNRELGLTSLVILNGTIVPPRYLIKSDEEKQEARCRFSLRKRGLLYVYVGPLIARKSVDLLIRAFVDQRVSKSDSTLCIVGEGPKMHDLICLANGNDHIVFTGGVSDVSEYLSMADVLISASKSEGLPNAVIEGLSWSLPLLLSDIPVHRSILGYNEVAGQLFPVNDVDMLVTILCSIEITVDAKCAARDIVLRNFDAIHMSKSYQTLYTELVGKVEQNATE